MQNVRKYAAGVFFAFGLIATRASDIAVPNGSFEQPQVPPDVPAYPVHVSWQQAPKRADYVDNPPFTWNVLTGVFPNTAPGSADHITNMDGNQAAYLFAENENGIFQELETKFETGVAYTMTAGLVGSPNIPPTVGSTLALIIYYRNTANEIVPITTTTVTYDTATFPTGTLLRDFSVKIPQFQNSAAWNGRNIGLLIKSTAASAGGVWDVENVRLDAVREFVQVPNFSFENPTVPSEVPASPVMNNWQKFPRPAFWDENTMGPWDNLMGIFPNPASGQQGHIDGVDRVQAGYIFATGGAGIYQDLNTKYELDATYRLTVGLVGSSAIPPAPSTSLDIALYYRDEQNNMITVASKTVVFNTENFPDSTQLLDFSANSHAVSSPAPWLGKNIGVYFVSSAGAENSGGVWDLDNVRITVHHGVKLRFAMEGTSVRISWDSAEGAQYQVLTASRVSSAPGDYTFAPFEDPIAGTGSEVSKIVPITGSLAFFEVRAALP